MPAPLCLRRSAPARELRELLRRERRRPGSDLQRSGRPRRPGPAVGAVPGPARGRHSRGRSGARIGDSALQHPARTALSARFRLSTISDTCGRLSTPTAAKLKKLAPAWEGGRRPMLRGMRNLWALGMLGCAALVTPAATAKETSHEVQSGQSLWSIAKRHGVSVDAIRERNALDESSPIRPGQKLRIPDKNWRPKGTERSKGAERSSTPEKKPDSPEATSAKSWVTAKPSAQTQTQKSAKERGINPCDTKDMGFGVYDRWSRESSIGQLIMPQRGGISDGQFDVMFHFHGHEPVRKEWVKVMDGAVLVGIDLGIGSGPYCADLQLARHVQAAARERRAGHGQEDRAQDGARSQGRAERLERGLRCGPGDHRAAGGRRLVDVVILLDALHSGYSGAARSTRRRSNRSSSLRGTRPRRKVHVRQPLVDHPARLCVDHGDREFPDLQARWQAPADAATRQRPDGARSDFSLQSGRIPRTRLLRQRQDGSLRAHRPALATCSRSTSSRAGTHRAAPAAPAKRTIRASPTQRIDLGELAGARGFATPGEDSRSNAGAVAADEMASRLAHRTSGGTGRRTGFRFRRGNLGSSSLPSCTTEIVRLVEIVAGRLLLRSRRPWPRSSERKDSTWCMFGIVACLPEPTPRF